MSEQLMTRVPERKLWNDGPNYTADAIIVDKSARMMLLIKRGDCGEWALPGGFVDPSDKSSAVTAIREAHEEANIELPKPLACVYQGIVDDPRNSEDAWIETSAYLFQTDYDATPGGENSTQAGDDAIEACWVEIERRPPLYASHSTFVLRALDHILSYEYHQAFKQHGDHYIRDVEGGHMGYEKQLHSSSESNHTIFQKSCSVSARSDEQLHAYLKKEANVMSHLRVHGYRHLPMRSGIIDNTTLVMEGFAPEHGWRWRAPITATDRYIRDCLDTFDELERTAMFPDTDGVQPSLDALASEGWLMFTRKKESQIRTVAEKLSPHFQANTRESLDTLLADLPALHRASTRLRLPERYVMAHHDARQSNIAWHPEHGARLVDWSWCGYGRPGSDATSFLIDMHKSGHDITGYLDRINPEHCLTLIGFWLEHSTRGSRANDGEVRRQQLLSAISGYEVLSLASAG